MGAGASAANSNPAILEGKNDEDMIPCADMAKAIAEDENNEFDEESAMGYIKENMGEDAEYSAKAWRDHLESKRQEAEAPAAAEGDEQVAAEEQGEAAKVADESNPAEAAEPVAEAEA